MNVKNSAKGLLEEKFYGCCFLVVFGIKNPLGGSLLPQRAASLTIWCSFLEPLWAGAASEPSFVGKPPVSTRLPDPHWRGRISTQPFLNRRLGAREIPLEVQQCREHSRSPDLGLCLPTIPCSVLFCDRVPPSLLLPITELFFISIRFQNYSLRVTFFLEPFSPFSEILASKAALRTKLAIKAYYCHPYSNEINLFNTSTRKSSIMTSDCSILC